jgi:hypothetical protein
MKAILTSLVLICLSASSLAQEQKPYGETGFEVGKTYVITNQDGFEYTGEILEDDGDKVVIMTKELGKVTIPKHRIKSIVPVAFSNYVPHGPFTTRYAFTTNAIPIKKGENYGMMNLFGPEVHFAVNDQLNVGVMSTWIGSPILVAGKYSFSTEVQNVNFSIGSLVGTTGYLNGFRGYGGLHWLNATVGDRQSNATLSAGYGYLQTGEEIAQEGVYDYSNNIYPEYETMKPAHGPIVSLAGIFKVGHRSSFVFDSMFGRFSHQSANFNYTANRQVVVHEDDVTFALFMMPGLRFQKEDRKAFQISLAGVSVFGPSSVTFPVPMASWFFQL